MDRKQLKEYLAVEVYDCSENDKKYFFIKRIYSRYCSVLTPPKYAVLLIRKMQYHASKGGRINNLISFWYHRKLLYKFSMYIHPNCRIGKGLKIEHPLGIVIGNCEIGENFTILHNCTIGSQRVGESNYMEKTKIGNNCILYANSLVLGPIKVCDNVKVGCNSMLNKDALISGTYVGTPAHLVIDKNSNTMT